MRQYKTSKKNRATYTYYSADGKTLSSIPSEATKTYVERILKYYEKYDEIYA